MVKHLPASAADVGLTSRWGRSLEEGNGNPLQYSCLGNPMDRRAWRAIDHEDFNSHIATKLIMTSLDLATKQ